MKSLATRALLLLAASGLSLFTLLKTHGTPGETDAPIPYSTIGHGPSILLLHDSSTADLDWAETARRLSTRFEVTLVDISKIIHDHQGIRQLRQTLAKLDIDDSHIAGSANGNKFALRYALSFPQESHHFVLPQNSEDLQILADIVNSTPFCKS
ncbi:hypothetical protein IEN85_05845 [Pelagicoccus sp. NFK12]|uniref:Uncharacterized protein n=1 Tax=Pelagicoccus enzymogenes TaxID=2773457 RepID=A0A927IEG0_9BACT|nr:hypothetical protein [Pelagicoccus enzymogenes]MBD5779007.1 hypothetical protein [Pelagicoccus enzymogenes]MDQ8200710.1 hypothetical protein [Pelagicoccus enzymogenes]